MNECAPYGALCDCVTGIQCGLKIRLHQAQQLRFGQDCRITDRRHNANPVRVIVGDHVNGHIPVVDLPRTAIANGVRIDAPDQFIDSVQRHRNTTHGRRFVELVKVLCGRNG